MSNIIFEVTTKAGLLLAAIIAVTAWIKCGMPYPTISRK